MGKWRCTPTIMGIQWYIFGIIWQLYGDLMGLWENTTILSNALVPSEHLHRIFHEFSNENFGVWVSIFLKGFLGGENWWTYGGFHMSSARKIGLNDRTKVISRYFKQEESYVCGIWQWQTGISPMNYENKWFKRETWDLTNNGDSTNRNGDVVGIFGSFLFIPTIPSGND